MRQIRDSMRQIWGSMRILKILNKRRLNKTAPVLDNRRFPSFF